MKKICVLLIILFVFIIPVKADNILNYPSPKDICEAIKKNNVFKIGLYNYYDKKSYEMISSTTDCSNVSYYNENDIKNGKSYAAFYRDDYENTIKMDNDVIKKANTNSDKYSPLAISNSAKDLSNLNYNNTLKPYEKVYIKLDISDKALNSSAYSDLRIKIQYGSKSGDIDITANDSIGYYIYADGKQYGPYKLAETSYSSIYTSCHNKSCSNIKVYDIVSENLLTKVPKGTKITDVKIVPYEFYTVRGGSLRIYSLSIDGYSSKYTNGKTYASVSGANNTIRHSIVNNMLENATLKWDIKKESGRPETIVYRCRLCKSGKIKTTGTTIYGLPYVNQYDTTIDAFISQTEKHDVSTNKDQAYFSYKLSNVYLANGTILDKNLSSSEKTVKKGDPIKTDTKLTGEGYANKSTMYVYDNPTNKTYNTDESISNLGRPYIANNNYYYGLDCSSSVFLAIGRTLPYATTMASSGFYFRNSEVRLLGNLNLSAYGVEKYIREKDTSGSLKNEQMTSELYQQYHDEYIRNGGVVGADATKKAVVAQSIYDAYAQLIPGDAVTTWGHVRMETGYPYIVCNNGKVIDSTSSTKYASGVCGNEGINPDKSYVIVTEVGDSSLQKEYNCGNTSTKYCTSTKTGVGKSVKEKYTGWSYSFNKNITDITNINQYYFKTNTSFRVNKIYTFKELYSNNTIYLPFRYIEMDKTVNQVEVPYAKLVLYDNKNVNNTIYNYLKQNKKLKGIIITNYIIEEVKVEIINNNKKSTYSVFPNQTNTFSLSNNMNDTDFLNTLKNLDYEGNLTFTVSVKTGPTNIKEVLTKLKQNNTVDDNGYIKVININHKKAVSSTPTPTPTSTTVNGDVNGNGKVDSADYILVRKHILKQSTLTGDKLKRADLNNDNKITSIDYVTIRKTIINLTNRTDNSSNNSSGTDNKVIYDSEPSNNDDSDDISTD